MDRRATAPRLASADGRGRWPAPLNVYLARAEESYLVRVLLRCGWNAAKAAERINVPYGTLWKKLKRYGLTKATRRPRTSDAEDRSHRTPLHMRTAAGDFANFGYSPRRPEGATLRLAMTTDRRSAEPLRTAADRAVTRPKAGGRR